MSSLPPASLPLQELPLISLECFHSPSHYIYAIRNAIKLEGVGLVDNRPSTNLLCNFVKKTKHVTHDTVHVIHGGG